MRQSKTHSRFMIQDNFLSKILHSQSHFRNSVPQSIYQPKKSRSIISVMNWLKITTKSKHTKHNKYMINNFRWVWQRPKSDICSSIASTMWPNIQLLIYLTLLYALHSTYFSSMMRKWPISHLPLSSKVSQAWI